jgi:hypothetical protein
MSKYSIFTDKQCVLIYKIHKYCRIFQLLNIRSSEFYKFIHSAILTITLTSNLILTIINFYNNYFKSDMNQIYNSIALISNSLLMAFDVFLSLQIKIEFYKTKSILFNSLANDIEEDLILEEQRNLEFKRIFSRFKQLIYMDTFTIPNIIFKQLKKKIRFENIEYEEIVLINSLEFLENNEINEIN